MTDNPRTAPPPRDTLRDDLAPDRVDVSPVDAGHTTPPDEALDSSELVWECPGGDPDEDGDAVEIAALPGGGYAMRNAADSPTGPVLYFTKGEWSAFVLGVRDGEFDA